MPRRDPAWVAALWAHPGAGIVEVDDDSNLAGTTADGLRLAKPSGEFDPAHDFLVGLIDGVPCFTRETGPNPPVATLRELSPLLDDTLRDLATTAVALINWHRTGPRCGGCGADTEVREGGYVRYCRACDRERFPRTDPAVIVAVLDPADRLLLAHHEGWPPNRMSILAGFVEAGECLEQAIVREIAEEAGITVTDIEYVASQSWPFPRSLMLGFTARCEDTELTVDGEEIDVARWFSRDEVTAAVACGELGLPGAASIASRMIQAWREGRLTQSSAG